VSSGRSSSRSWCPWLVELWHVHTVGRDQLSIRIRLATKTREAEETASVRQSRGRAFAVP